MNKFNILSRDSHWMVAIVVAVSLLMWLTGLPGWVNSARAAALTTISDTLSDSDLSVVSNHTIVFTTQSAISASSTIVIDFTAQFNSTSTPAFATSDANDYDISTSTADMVVNAAGGCPSSGNTQFSITSVANSSFTFTHCNGTNDLPANATTTIQIGTNATFGGTGDSQLVNPGTAQSYAITITAPSADTADLRVAIIDDVTVTASVDTSLTFTITGVGSGIAINGDATTTSSGATATALPFGTLTVGSAQVLGQDLAITTNATNGFSVTLQLDQPLTSAGGADIDLFKDGAGTVTPTAWTSPLGTLDSENTYGHIGFTSEDSDLNSDEFGTALYAGNATTSAREVFSHTGPADGSTADKGLTRIGYKIQITGLQEAASDYTAAVTYVATPIF